MGTTLVFTLFRAENTELTKTEESKAVQFLCVFESARNCAQITLSLETNGATVRATPVDGVSLPMNG
jgi:hypothetical protein